ncbi:MAG: AraC family transcriptional regulator [Sphingobacteriaceae bacterium]|nr:MAG: AraC family transcriptional regulator [Sphingobacteriaceae bacterium]
MKQAGTLLTFDSISQLMCRLDLPGPQHPLVAIVNYDTAKFSLADAGNKFLLQFYKITFKTSFKGQVRYGQGYYDFEEGGMAFLAPGQIVTMPAEERTYEGYALYFHPDLIRGYPLSHTIGYYGFFSYGVSEALFLSDKEKKVIAALFEAIRTELDNHTDQFSQDVLVSQIELLLNHSNRFYNRQFLTRKTVNHELIDRMNVYLLKSLDPKRTSLKGLPSAQDVADHLKVSPRYLSDMLRSLTGQTTQQHLHNQLIEKAKSLLTTSTLSVAEIAYHLGFEHPQSFNKLFKQKVTQSPLQFRRLFDN